MAQDISNIAINASFQNLVQVSSSAEGNMLATATGTDFTVATASFALNSAPQVSASYATSASHADFASEADNANTSTTASYALIADSATTASYAESAIAENVIFDDTSFAYTASNVQVALERLSTNKADISQLSSNITTFPTTASADVGGYFALVSSSVDARYNETSVNVPTGEITATGQLISSLITDSYLFLGNPGLVNLNTNGQIRKVGGSGEATFYYEVYSRSGSVETLIATSDNTSPVTSTTYAEFSAAAILNNGTFTEDDRIVLKFYANKVGGGSNPSYQFQFGGDTPVRTLFPVPASVLVSPWNGQFEGEAVISGSLIVTQGITGSLDGNASTATSASYASNGGVTSIIAGTNITIDQSTGDVTIDAAGGGGGGSVVPLNIKPTLLSALAYGTTNGISAWYTPYKRVNAATALNQQIVEKSMWLTPFTAEEGKVINEVAFTTNNVGSPYITVGIYDSEATTFTNNTYTYDGYKPANLLYSTNIPTTVAGALVASGIALTLPASVNNTYFIALFNPNQTGAGNVQIRCQGINAFGGQYLEGGTVVTDGTLTNTQAWGSCQTTMYYNNLDGITTIPSYVDYDILGPATNFRYAAYPDILYR